MKNNSIKLLLILMRIGIKILSLMSVFVQYVIITYLKCTIYMYVYLALN